MDAGTIDPQGRTTTQMARVVGVVASVLLTLVGGTLIALGGPVQAPARPLFAAVPQSAIAMDRTARSQDVKNDDPSATELEVVIQDLSTRCLETPDLITAATTDALRTLPASDAIDAYHLLSGLSKVIEMDPAKPLRASFQAYMRDYLELRSRGYRHEEALVSMHDRQRKR